MRAWNREGSFKELTLKEKAVTQKLTQDELEGIFNLNKYFKNIDYIFKRAGLD